jgi:hypothetical protein
MITSDGIRVFDSTGGSNLSAGEINFVGNNENFDSISKNLPKFPVALNNPIERSVVDDRVNQERCLPIFVVDRGNRMILFLAGCVS